MKNKIISEMFEYSENLIVNKQKIEFGPTEISIRYEGTGEFSYD